MVKSILVINTGSSSMKFKLFTKNSDVLLSGIFDSIGFKKSFVEYSIFDNLKLSDESNNKSNDNFNKKSNKKYDEKSIENKKNIEMKIESHKKAFDLLLKIIYEELKINKEDILGVGHRVVHGGNFENTSEMTEDNLEKLKKISSLAPLHNPNAVIGIEESIKVFDKSKIFACFDTIFFKDMPDVSKKYAISDIEMVRKYGFHGLSYSYLYDYIKKKYKSKNLIICHIGNGSSIVAIKNGRVIDTTMGLSPLEGLIMGTRSGDIDPEVVFFLQREKNMTYQEVSDFLNKKSGLKAMCGTNDMRIIWENVKDVYKNNLFDDPKNKYDYAYKKYVKSIIKYVSYYKTEIGKIDAIVFSGGMGEKAYYLRESVLQYFDDIKIDKIKNKKGEEIFSKEDSKIKAMVIETNEEFFIFNEVKKYLKF
ncbi:MAG: acetate/propionate family kinase [Candidatus Nanoarchaeia archaeon]|nr:acetate/propionate family kinase [Candidatus Nanoarchaeia archaeon]